MTHRPSPPPPPPLLLLLLLLLPIRCCYAAPAAAAQAAVSWCGSPGIWSGSRRAWRPPRAGDGLSPSPPPSPPRFADLSPDEQVNFTRCGRIPVEKSMFVDDSGGQEGTFYRYGADHIAQMLASARELVALVRGHGARRGAAMHGRRRRGGRRPAPPPRDAEVWLLEALLALSDDSRGGLGVVVIFGSQSPWYEALCLAFGATRTITVEYNRLDYAHPDMAVSTVDEFWDISTNTLTHDNNSSGPADVVLSISSFDHDGLGRYGDPVSPDGDLLTMRRLRNALAVVTASTRLVLSVPCGPDLLAWNLMRRYGRVRLPLLLDGWDVVARHGWDEARLDLPHAGNGHFRRSWEPVFVLAPSSKPSAWRVGDEDDAATASADPEL